MDKEEFLKRLKNKLSILDDSEVEDIISEYSEHIDEKMKDGVSEKDAIKEFGDINELSSDILSAYKVNKNYSEDKIGTFVDSCVDGAKEVFDKIVKILTHGTVLDIFKLIIFVLILLLIIALVKIPFELLEELLNNAFVLLPDSIEHVFNVFISVVVNLSYVVIGALLFVKMLKERLLDNYKIEKEIGKEIKSKKKTNSSKKEDEEPVKESKITYTGRKSFIDVISDLILFMFRVIAAFILLPSVVGIVFSSIGIAILIIFSIKYALFFGPIIICVGVLIGCIWMSELLFRFIFNKKGSFTKSFITFIIALVLCGVGVGVSISEFTNLDYQPVESEVVALNTYDFNMMDVNNVICWNCKKIDKKVDNTMNDNEYKVIVYGTKYQKPLFDKDDNSVEFYYDGLEVELIKEYLNGIKSKKLYDLENTYLLSIEIIGNENTLNNILTKNRAWD